MFIGFLYALRRERLPVSITEFLTLLRALKAGIVGPENGCSLDDFYHLARSALVKDEKHFDRFDRAFGAYFQGVAAGADFAAEMEALAKIPEEWLRQQMRRILSPEQMAALETMDFDALMNRLQELLEEQKERHEGGNKWIGTGGTSPFGHGGYNPQGIRIGGQSRHRRAVKVWEQRQWRDYDEDEALGVRALQVALRRLRRFARQGGQLQLDVPATVRATAEQGGWLDIQMRPERHNSVKVLLLLDAGGSMDWHVQRVRELFSAARAAFKHLEVFHFHNCVYENIWRDGAYIPTQQVINTYGRDYKLIFVGDAAMSIYEILQPGGAIDFYNAESGAVWMERLTSAFSRSVWLNPEPQGEWRYTQSTGIMQQLMQGRMYPLTLAGLDEAMHELAR